MHPVMRGILVVMLLASAHGLAPLGRNAVLTAAGQAGSAATTVALFDDCPVTVPVLADPPEPNQPAGMDRSPLGIGWWHISDDGLIWTAAAPFRETGGEKVHWLKPVGAEFFVTGQPYGAEGPSLIASIPTGYLGDFQSTGITFPTPGCWEVTARANESELRFVTYVFPEGVATRSSS